MPEKIKVTYVAPSELRAAEYNPRTHTPDDSEKLKESIRKFGCVDPIIANKSSGRENVIIGGHFRLEVAKELKMETVPVVYLNIPDINKEKELCIRLNKNTGSFDLELLAEFDETLLNDIGFSSEELDEIFGEEEKPEVFDLEKELGKLDITKVEIQKGDVYEINGSRLMCGDSTIEADVMKLMNGKKADMVMTDPPYRLDYLHGKKRNGKATEGFGLKRDRKYLETDVLPDDFTDLWMNNVKKVSQDNFSIIVYENWKNLREIWGCMEKHWKVRNMIVWHLPNRIQGFAAKNKFFNKYDIAMVGTTIDKDVSTEQEDDPLLQNEYETALYATAGKAHFEEYESGKKYCPSDFVDFVAADEKSSGQGIIFGTKPIEILIPYIKVLTKRDGLVLETFGGSGSTLIASLKLKRRCYIMEKSPVYAEVIKKRWENMTGEKAKKIA